MKLGDTREFGEKTFHLRWQHLTKAEAEQKAAHMRRGQFSARLVRVGRGDWQVWTR